jgi:hypothetical protein
MVGGAHIAVTDNGATNITGPYRIAGNAQAHWYITLAGKLLIGSTSIDCGGGTLNFSVGFLQCEQQARVTNQGATFTNASLVGGYEYSIAHGSFFSKSGISLPHSAPGTADATSLAY